jgi:hypothetical protein
MGKFAAESLQKRIDGAGRNVGAATSRCVICASFKADKFTELVHDPRILIASSEDTSGPRLSASLKKHQPGVIRSSGEVAAERLQQQAEQNCEGDSINGGHQSDSSGNAWERRQGHASRNRRVQIFRGTVHRRSCFQQVFLGHNADGEWIWRELFGMCKSVDVWQQQALN